MNKSYHRMIRILLIALLLILTVASLAGPVLAESPAVHVIAIDGEITPAMAAFLERGLTEAADSGAVGVLIEISTLGGRVDAAIAMRDAIFASTVPVAVYIGDRAISAGALISIAADTIIMAPGSHIGAAEPIPNDPKSVAYVSGEFRATAERTGRDPQVATAMADRSVVIEGLVTADQILDMTANEATERGYAEHLAASRSEAIQYLGWSQNPVIEVKPDFSFQIAQFLTSYEIASILLTLGLLALLAEFFTPGFGAPGIVGIVCLVLYFTSGFMAGYTEWWAVLIFLAGLVLLLLELAAPGFGIFGISGFAAIAAGVILAAPTPALGARTLLIALVVLIIAVPVFLKIFGHSRFVRRFVLSHAETSAKGYVHAAAQTELLGLTGRTLTDLRPAGSVQIDGNRVDALAEGEFINKGVMIKVIRVEGTKVVVAATEQLQS